MSMLMAKLHNFRAPMACLWDILYINYHKHAHFMYQHSVICWWVCFRPNCIIFLCLWRAYEILCIGILILKHAQYMYQDYVMCSWACLWPYCIIFVCLSACLWDTLYRESHKHGPVYVHVLTFCNTLMSMLMAKLHYVLLPVACLWDTLYRDSHKHAQYMYQHSVIYSWACLWPNCIIFVCLSACLWDTL